MFSLMFNILSVVSIFSIVLKNWVWNVNVLDIFIRVLSILSCSSSLRSLYSILPSSIIIEHLLFITRILSFISSIPHIFLIFFFCFLKLNFSFEFWLYILFFALIYIGKNIANPILASIKKIVITIFIYLSLKYIFSF